MNIKCLLYARYSTSLPIHTINQESSNKSLTIDTQKLPSKIKALRSKVGERDKLRTAYGVWYVTHDDNDISYGVCTGEDYPERHAYALIEILKKKISQINHCEYQTQENIKAFSKKTAIELVEKYNDLAKIDKVYKASEEVKGLEQELNVGIKKIIGNQETLSQMEGKAERMKGYASEFQKNSEQLEKMLYWRNCKIKIIVGLMIVGLIGVIILVIVQKTNSSSSTTPTSGNTTALL